MCGASILHRDDSHACGYGRGARWTYFYDMQLSTQLGPHPCWHITACPRLTERLWGRAIHRWREEFGETRSILISALTVAASLSLGVFIANVMINPGRQPKLERLELLRA